MKLKNVLFIPRKQIEYCTFIANVLQFKIAYSVKNWNDLAYVYSFPHYSATYYTCNNVIQNQIAYTTFIIKPVLAAA